MATTTTSSRDRLFQDQMIPGADGEQLHAKLMTPKAPACAQRVVVISPLVGAGAGQPLLTFRNFARRGAIVISFEYCGHPGSTGKFELDKTLSDTRAAVLWAAEYAKERGLPLHGFATCYGTIPLLAQFKEGGPGPLLRSVNTISGLYQLNQILRIEDFAPIASRHLERELTIDQLMSGIDDRTIDCTQTPFRKALQEYLAGLMPELRVELNRFEELDYDRVNLRETLLQFTRADYLDGVHVPPWIPCTTCYGTQDNLLKTDSAEGREDYRRRVLSMVPHASIHEFDMDHYGRGPGHSPVIDCVCDAFERYDAAPVPPPHLDIIHDYRRAPR